jgi:hypothetical protein
MPAWSPPYGFLHHTIEAPNNELCFHAIMENRMFTNPIEFLAAIHYSEIP